MTTEKETTILPVELKNRNAGRGHHWSNSHKERQNFETVLRVKGFARTPYLYPVRLTITRILGEGQAKWDADSVGRGNAKELIDALVALGWFTDDGPRYITIVDYRQDECRRTQGPAVEVTIEADGKPFGADKQTATFDEA